MRHKRALAIVLAWAAIPPSMVRAQSPQVTDIEFPSGVLDLGRLLSAGDVNVVTFAARGTRGSEGSFSFANAIDDVGAALAWLRDGGRGFNVDPKRIAIGGHSLGEGDPEAVIQEIQPDPAVTIIANPDGHFFRASRERMASDIRAWLARQFAH